MEGMFCLAERDLTENFLNKLEIKKGGEKSGYNGTLETCVSSNSVSLPSYNILRHLSILGSFKPCHSAQSEYFVSFQVL